MNFFFKKIKKIKKIGFRQFLRFLFVGIFLKKRVFVYRYILSDNKSHLNDVDIIQATYFTGAGTITVKSAQLGVRPSPGLLDGVGYIEARYKGAKVTIDEETVINNGFVIISEKSVVSIGKRCLIGPNFFVTDSDFHGIEVDDRTNGSYECSPVVIEDDVFIGESVKIMKGVRVGRGAVLGVGSVVTKDVEPFSVNAGVPAKQIRYLRGKT
ncbi:acyltransferase [Alishewanella sp. HL-SH05]|uniref:acyltransferase n=1 Tax=Alishewanella sp. HL-SH05 TaxID=3461145 RepID=UPI0040435634